MIRTINVAKEVAVKARTAAMISLKPRWSLLRPSCAIAPREITDATHCAAPPGGIAGRSKWAT
ncbi:MAG: hypothetical protein ACRDVN_01975 [Jiangellaceae bacterium]